MEEKASYPQTSGKVTGVKCRVCLKSMVLQNYSTHLKMKHPNQNSKDLRGKEDQDISVLFNRKRKMADDKGGLKKTKSIDQNHNNAQELSDEAASTPLPTDDLLDFSDTELNETKNETNLNEKTEQNNNLTEFNNLLSKLSPLAKVDDSTISKLVENLEALSKLDLNK